MISKKAFFKTILVLLLLALAFGFVLPTLISAKSTFGTLLGAVILLAICIAGIYQITFYSQKDPK